MLFNKRTISTSSELNFCLAICRVIKVGYISLLVSALLYSTYSIFGYLTLDSVIALSLSCVIGLTVIHLMSHIKDVNMRDDCALQDNPIKASIWEIHKADGITLIDNFNEK